MRLFHRHNWEWDDGAHDEPHFDEDDSWVLITVFKRCSSCGTREFGFAKGVGGETVARLRRADAERRAAHEKEG